MLFNKQLRWQVSNTTGAIFLVLLTIVVIFMMIRVLSSASKGTVDPKDILLLMTLSSVIYLPHIIIGSLFIATIIVLTRWYTTSEMIVWQSSGLSLIRFFMPIWRLSIPFFILVCILAFFLWPWSNNYIEQLKIKFKQKDELSYLISGQFFELKRANKLLFIEKIDNHSIKEIEEKCKNLQNLAFQTCKAEHSKLHGMFAASLDIDKLDLIVSKQGFMQEENDGNYAYLQSGQRYMLNTPQKIVSETTMPENNYQFKHIKFDELRLKLNANKQHSVNLDNLPERAMPTLQLWQQRHTSKNAAIELGWRIGLPISLLILQLWALVLAHANPRKNKNFNIVLSVVVYIVYNNIVNISQVWMSKGAITSILFGSISVHLFLFILGLLILIYRTYEFYFVGRWLKQ
jgi:lipopolysaccharide export system permease protein